MAVYKDKKRGTWYTSFPYVDWTGKRCRKLKRGFLTKKEAQNWENHFKLQKANSLDMTFEDFYGIYEADVKPKIRYNTWCTKEHIIKTKILPYFKDLSMRDITPRDIIKWQNIMRESINNKGKEYTGTYLKTVQAQLSSIFNHAVRFYELPNNPVRVAGPMGQNESDEMKFWTKEEYMKFIPTMANKTYSYMAFELLYWCGIRLGDDDDKIRLNQRKPSKYKGLRRFGPEKNLQRINKFMKERPIFYKNLIQMKENIRFYLRCFYCITKVMILQFNSENRTELARNG